MLQYAQISKKEVIIIKGRPTIQMVADKAGVSRGTVDRVLNNRAHVSPEIHAKVMEALLETGYLAPKQIHQKNLEGSEVPTLKLGVLLPNWTGHFKSEILKGIEAAKEEFIDFQTEILIRECQTDVPLEAIELIDELLTQGVQGIALCTPNTPTITEKVDKLWNERKFPVITFNSDLPNSSRLTFVGQNYIQSGRIAAELTSKCIPKNGKILIAVGNLEFNGHRARLQGFQERMQELNYSESQMHIIETFNDYQTTYRKVLEYLKQQPETCAIYMANRSVAGCTEAVKTAGKKGDIRIICHDVAESTKLLLQDGSIDFTITQNLFRQGYVPLTLLRDYLQKKKLPESNGIATPISIICSQNMDQDYPPYNL